ncbi:glycosyltransferase family 4 protein [Thermodesulfatator autotrophicus]|uniref:glycosyltransferase family 4 protein n=1 Tax=Thermodesulfatator autotrophicus TaxID=1795632 RepID=UPI0012FBDC0B|nr:glycosyltransferase family 4 protein [Thermodesulfatator autotrophicus]
MIIDLFAVILPQKIMARKKILFIKRKFSPFGGAELYLKRVISFLKRDYEIAVLSEKWPAQDGIEIFVLPKAKLLSDLFFALQAKNFLKKKECFDLVVSFDRTISQDIYRASDGCHLRWLKQRKLFENKLKVNYSKHFRLKNRIISWLEKKCLQISKKIIANSNMVKNDFNHFYGSDISNKTIVCYNGVNLSIFSPISSSQKEYFKKKLNLPSMTDILLFIGSGYKRKGLDIVLDYFEKYSNKNQYLVVIGKEKRLMTYKKRISSKLQDKVRFLGPTTNTVIYYQSADLFILPTYYDPFANTTLEAMACGLPVITTPYNGASEIIKNGKEGFILDNSSHKEFNNNLTEAIFKIKDSYNFFSRNSYQKACLFELEKQTNLFVKQLI